MTIWVSLHSIINSAVNAESSLYRSRGRGSERASERGVLIVGVDHCADIVRQALMCNADTNIVFV